MTSNDPQEVVSCPGPLVWFAVLNDEVVLECAACGYVHVGSGVPFDAAHTDTETMTEGVR